MGLFINKDMYPWRSGVVYGEVTGFERSLMPCCFETTKPVLPPI
jgi:hypothetical protein